MSASKFLSRILNVIAVYLLNIKALISVWTDCLTNNLNINSKVNKNRLSYYQWPTWANLIENLKYSKSVWNSELKYAFTSSMVKNHECNILIAQCNPNIVAVTNNPNILATHD